MKRLVLSILLAAPGVWAASPAEIARELDEVARVASVMVDGDACERIVTRRALDYLLKTDPRDPFIDSDNYDVDHEPFLRTKKTLIRLSRLASFPCDVNLWMAVPGKPGKVQVVIRNAHEMSQFWTWGALAQDTPEPMRKVLAAGERIRVTARPGWISVLAPVYDSLGDIAGLVEAVAQTKEDPQANVK
jgi:hypothetical protein